MALCSILRKAAGTSISSCRYLSLTPLLGRRRVVVTGLGVVSPLGCSTEVAWDRLVNGAVATHLNTLPGFEEIPSKVVALVPRGTGKTELDVSKYATSSDLKLLSTSMIYALAAADEAVVDSGWKPRCSEDLERTGVAIGSGMVDFTEVIHTAETFISKGYRRVSPYFIPKVLINLVAGHVSIKYGFLGPNHSVSTACTTGTHAIGDAMRMIRNGDADVMVCGGSEAGITPLGLAGFARARALSTSFNHAPQTASRPFDSLRDGFVPGEGAGVLILEEYEHARTRGAKLYAEILGYGMSGDAYHITAPRADGLGAQLCMRACLRDAQVSPSTIQYINCHATSTPLGDKVENMAIKKVFGPHAENLQLSSFKGSIGHLLGAAGAVESVFTVLALHKGIVPPSVNILDLEKEFDLNYVPNICQEFGRRDSRRMAVKNSFGFGGTNASLCIAEVN